LVNLKPIRKDTYNGNFQDLKYNMEKQKYTGMTISKTRFDPYKICFLKYNQKTRENPI